MEKKARARKFPFFGLIFILLLLIVGCASETKSPLKTGTPSATPTSWSAPVTPVAQSSLQWDPVFTAPVCRADGNAPLLDQALAQTGLTRATFGFSASDFKEAPYYFYGYLGDEFMLPWFKDVRSHPARAGCFEGEVAGALDFYLNGPHPVSSIIRHSSRLLGNEIDKWKPIDPDYMPGDFDQALAALCEAAQGCSRSSGEIPPKLKEALTPLLRAMVEGIKARAKMDEEAVSHNADWWNQNGGNMILINVGGKIPDPADIFDRDYLVGAARWYLYRAASQIAFAIEDIDWSPFAGKKGVRYDLNTGAGLIKISDGANDVYLDNGQEILLLIDLGGNDIHFDGVAANRSGKNPLSIAIDLAGNDRYEYQVYATPYDRDGLVGADDAQRYQGDARYGNVSLSEHSRQGAARNGIAMLFDLGQGNDRYQSLRASQGYAHFGVGVLFDDGGNDVYLSETASQGSAQFGIGLLIDAGSGKDAYRSFTYSQGFGWVAGVGILFDEGGDDSYSCDHGDPQQGGIPFYSTPQLPGKGNLSFCQGAGFGKRGNDQNKQTFLSGGIGILRDKNGDDTYEASVFAQGTGYWQGTGILSDGGGNDRYDAYWYAQGGAAHFAVGILADAGKGDDVFNATRPSLYTNLGAGHDFSVGVLINEKGDDTYYVSNLSAGASNCNGIGLFVDNGGNDAYIASSDYGSGMGNAGEGCIERSGAVSIGIMIDAGGKDVYSYPESKFPVPDEGKTWGHSHNGLPSEHGAGLDGEGETGVHPESE